MCRSLVVCLLFLASLAVAQTKAVPTNRLNQCQDSLQEANTARWTLVGTNVDLQLKNKDLQTQNAELTKKYEELRSAAKDVLGYTQTLDVQYRNMLADFKFLSEAYDSAIRERDIAAQATASQQNLRANQQQRVANAIALYQAMPKYQPPQTINVNVSDCTRLPALCVGR